VSAATKSAFVGELRVPGDKSVTQRVLLLGAVAQGETVARGALRAGDTLSTAGVVAALGARVAWDEAPGGPTLRVTGVETPASPPAPLDCGNAGTCARLALGLLAGHRGRWTLTGDDSLRRRPMGRVVQPLAALGARIEPAAPHGVADRLPLAVHGAALRGGSIEVALPSAQVKSELLLAGLRATAPLTVAQHVQTRDHTERLLPRFGLRVQSEPGATTVHPGRPRAATLDVPGDPSSAAFAIVAALLAPRSELWVRDVGLWPRRTGFLRVLLAADAGLMVLRRRATSALAFAGPMAGAARETGGEVALGETAETRAWAGPAHDDPRGDLRAVGCELSAFDIAPEDVPDLVDEVPILALAAARARGTSRFAGLAELRVKESDRVATIAELLCALGITVRVLDDGLEIDGAPQWREPSRWPVFDDHRLALCCAVAALVEDWALPPGASLAAAGVSWPGGVEALAALRTG
jgi:3-phosphoshikimate 1-carboxyvinyltransferase